MTNERMWTRPNILPLTSELLLKGFPSSHSNFEPSLLAIQLTRRSCKSRQCWSEQTCAYGRLFVRRKETHTRCNVNVIFRVCQGAREGCSQRGFMGLISIEISNFDLQGNVLLTAEGNQWHSVVPSMRKKVRSQRVWPNQIKLQIKALSVLTCSCRYPLTVLMEQRCPRQSTCGHSDTSAANCSGTNYHRRTPS